MISATRKNSVREIAALQDPRWLGDHTVPHRAFRTLQPSLLEMALGFLVAVAATAGWIVLLPRVASLWVKLLSFWIGRLWSGTSVLLLPRTVVGHWQVPVPYFTVDAGPIAGWTWVAIAAGSVVLFLASYRIPIDNHLPYVYMMRAFALIQWSALLYTALAQRPFPADASEYCASMLLFGMIYIGVMPGILGFTFYIFDVSIWRKIALTAFIMAHLTLFIPLQYLTHACILHVSLLFLPLLYFVFGPLIDVVVLLGFYSWGMSWPSADGVAGYPYTAGAPIISVPQRYR